MTSAQAELTAYDKCSPSLNALKLTAAADFLREVGPWCTTKERAQLIEEYGRERIAHHLEKLSKPNTEQEKQSNHGPTVEDVEEEQNVKDGDDDGEYEEDWIGDENVA